MVRATVLLANAAATLAATSAQAAVTITTNAAQPAVGTFDHTIQMQAKGHPIWPLSGLCARHHRVEIDPV